MGIAFLSPLRYPGGKGALAPFLGQLISAQRRRCTTYVEPFAGGAGAAVRLLFDEYVERIVLNDLDRGVAAFWQSLLHQTAAMTELVERRDLTVKEWHRQREIYNSTDADELELGFATFYLNRTNRSGILNARPIGGLEQTGQWKIDARFNRQNLVMRIRLLAQFRNRITICNEDGIDFVTAWLGGKESCFIYADPPYIDKGSDLYLNTLSWADHQRLAAILRGSQAKWMVTYDCDPRVPTELYAGLRCVAFDIAHTAQKQHVGQEYAVFSNGLEVGSLAGLRVEERPA